MDEFMTNEYVFDFEEGTITCNGMVVAVGIDGPGHGVCVGDFIGLGDNFDDLFDVEDDYDYTDGTMAVDRAMWDVTADRFTDINKVDEGANGVVVIMADVADAATWLMQDVDQAVECFISPWLPGSADVNPLDAIYTVRPWKPTAELET